MAVYAQPRSTAEAAATPADAHSTEADAAAGKASKKRKLAATTAAAASSSSATAAPLLRYLYYKPHVTASSSEDDSIKPGCTLFVVNIPFFYTVSKCNTHAAQCAGCVNSERDCHSSLDASCSSSDLSFSLSVCLPPCG